MLGRFRISTVLSFFVTISLVYYAFLGGTGMIERGHLENRLKYLREEVERLETENQNLKNRHLSGGYYGSDYQIFPEMARIIKFKEFVEVAGEDKILTSHIPLSIFRNKQLRSQNISLQFVKFFYFTAVFALGLVLIIRFKQKS
jgi:hypothetical protein